MAGDEEGSPTRRLADELADCRRRGVERLDYSGHNQRRLPLPKLERLADRYCAIYPPIPPERYARIKRLLRGALGVMQVRSPSDASLIRGVFFGEFADRVGARPRELFEQTMEKFRIQNQNLFREQVDQAMVDFAHFLLDFVRREEAKPTTKPPLVTVEHPLLALVSGGYNWIDDELGTDTDVELHPALIGLVKQRKRFTELLARAESATIIGSTNEYLASNLDRALARKRELQGDPGAFWRKIRVVFLDDQLLADLSDERPAAPDRKEARRKRQIAATYGRRSVSAFFRRNSEDSWQIFESPAFPPTFGTLFELPAGQRLVHLLIRRPTLSGSEAMYVEFADTASHYFAGVFEDVLRRCINDNKAVPIGVPGDSAFHIQRFEYRDRVLVAGSGADGWVPQVLIVTWQRNAGGAEPLLQFRRPGIAAKYDLDTLCHPVGTILESDLTSGPDLGHRPGVSVQEIGVPDPAPSIAATRRLRIETGDDPPGELHPLDPCVYLNHDMEHQYYFVFTCEFPGEYQFPHRSEIHRVPLPELVRIRNHQVLRQAAVLCGLAAPLPLRIRAEAFEIASLNLRLHGHAELAGKVFELGSHPYRGSDQAKVGAELAELAKATRPWPWVSDGRDVELRGLAGFQYREFFSRLLPVYDEFGVPEAGRLLDEIDGDSAQREAVDRLAVLYHSQQVMPHISIEL